MKAIERYLLVVLQYICIIYKIEICGKVLNLPKKLIINTAGKG